MKFKLEEWKNVCRVGGVNMHDICRDRMLWCDTDESTDTSKLKSTSIDILIEILSVLELTSRVPRSLCK